MALIILNTPTFNVDEFEQPYNIPMKESEETFAFGYGINEFRKLPEEPHKVPIKLIEEENSSECGIYFYFSGAARSCLGDSGGPVFSYLNNNNQESSTPLFIGLSLQIALYVDSKNKNKKFIYGENVNLRDEEMEKCRTANELSVLKKECILGWLEYLVYNESNFRRKEILKEIFNSFIWK
uniref:Peptidase S1 domain-containing protein n=1 Tax=Meloidogyne incognita TaxID=6306 RepID=A0A914KJW7_MELIC